MRVNVCELQGLINPRSCHNTITTTRQIHKNVLQLMVAESEIIICRTFVKIQLDENRIVFTCILIINNIYFLRRLIGILRNDSFI